jgi:precorrin-2 dehydrogenase/sirohydrochlorin ferrochelatase
MEATDNTLYPVSLKLAGSCCVVVGGGRVAERKVRGLLGTGAEIRVISPDLTDQLAEWKNRSLFRHIPRAYEAGDLEGAQFVFAATNHRDVNLQVYHDSIRVGAQVNLVDQPELCTFYVPSVLRRGDLTLAVSTSGRNPALAKAIREHLESLFGREWEMILSFLNKAREHINARISDPAARAALYRSWVAELLLLGGTTNEEEIHATMGKLLERLETHENHPRRDASESTGTHSDGVGM